MNGQGRAGHEGWRRQHTEPVCAVQKYAWARSAIEEKGSASMIVKRMGKDGHACNRQLPRGRHLGHFLIFTLLTSLDELGASHVAAVPFHWLLNIGKALRLSVNYLTSP